MNAALIFLITAAIAGGLTIVVRRLAPQLNLTDRPDGHRKLHGHATPLGGGLAVILATVTMVAILLILSNPWQEPLQAMSGQLVSLGLAAIVIVTVGLIDDRIQLRGRQKLLGQLLAIGILIHGGLVIHSVALFGYEIQLGALALLFTGFWLLGAVNAMNLLDGIDGLASMLGLILVATIAGVAALTGRIDMAILALIFAGALAGFLPFNFPPATIFLGDAGSMLIGLLTGALAIHGSLKGPGTLLLAAPLAIWTLPILDSAAALIRRRLTGRSVFATDRAHLHHRLMERLGTNRRVLALVALCCLITSLGALGSVAFQHDLIAALTGLSVVAMLAVSRFFGHTEFTLIRRRVRSTVHSLISRGERSGQHPVAEALCLQGTRQWDHVWSALVEPADKLGITAIHLDLNLPMLQEAYNGSWQRLTPPQSDRAWHVDVPLVLDGTAVGRLTLTGEKNGASLESTLDPLVTILDSIETELSTLLDRAEALTTN